MAVAGVAAGIVWAAPVLTADPSPAIAQHVAVPAYIDPTADPVAWATLASPASGTGGIVVANVLNGPGAAADPAWHAALNRAHASGQKVLGYVDSGYLGSPIASAPAGLPTRSSRLGLQAWLPQIGQDINAWYRLYGSDIDGIFLDEGTNQCGPGSGSTTYAATYRQLTTTIKRDHPGALTVLNPGTAVPECYQQSADVLVTFEGSYGDYTGTPASAAEAYVPLQWNPVDPAKIWHLVYGVADEATMQQVVQLSKSRGAGWIYVTNDIPANPYDTLPPASYWALEQAQAAAVATAESPVAPADLDASATSRDHGKGSGINVKLRWSQVDGGSSPVVAYDIRENNAFLTSVPAGTGTFTATELTPATNYTFTVTARNAAGASSPPSSPVTVSTRSLEGTLPSAPQLSLTGTTSSTASLTWTPPADHGPIASYDLYEGTTLISRLPATLQTAIVGFTQPGLSTSTFSVRTAQTDGGVSPPSNYVAATAVPVPGNEPIGSPSVTLGADGSVTYAAEFALPFAFRRVFIAAGTPGLGCWTTGGDTPLCAQYMVENGEVYKYAGQGTDFSWTPLLAVPPVINGADTYTWTVPGSVFGSSAGQTVVFNGEGYSPLTWATEISVGTPPPQPSAPYQPADQAVLQASVLSALRAMPVPVPSGTPTPPSTGGGAFCPTHPDGKWHLGRQGGCMVGDLTVHSSLLDGLLVGDFTVQLTDRLTLSTTGRTWQESVTLELLGVAGNVPPYSMTVTPTCPGTCQEGAAVTVILSPGQPTSFEVDGTDAAAVSTDWLQVAWIARLVPQLPAVSLPFVPPSGVTSLQWSTPDVRCDSVASATPGCVLPEVIQTFSGFSLGSSTLGDVASNVSSAELAGGWGLKGIGRPLAYTSDPQLVSANVDNGCSLTPAQLADLGDSCDQYPFSSTYQGSSQTPDAVAVPMDVTEEAQATALLDSWYASQRLLDGDQFWVAVVP